MSIVRSIRDEAAEMRLKTHLEESIYSADHQRIIEILERQANIIENIGEN